jgi:hypothetical protein
MLRSERTGARWGRVVTYGVVAGLLVAAQLELEVWPVTSFRLFSQIRTDRSVGMQLVAVDADGARVPVPLDDVSDRVGNVVQQLELLRTDDPEVQRAKAIAWLQLVGIGPEGVERAELERVQRRLDPDGGPATVVGRTVVVVIPL